MNDENNRDIRSRIAYEADMADGLRSEGDPPTTPVVAALLCIAASLEGIEEMLALMAKSMDTEP